MIMRGIHGVLALRKIGGHCTEDIELTLSHGAIHSGIEYSVDGILPRLKGLVSTKGVPCQRSPALGYSICNSAGTAS